MLYLYNSLTRSKELFQPLNEGKIGFYACGITVYDHCHLGHARSMVCLDVMVRFLRHQGYDVNFVRNITDIDDKIIFRAQERGIGIDELTEEFIRSMHEDAKALGLLPPDREPRATTHMPAIISLIQRLMDKGYAYATDSGDLCFEVARFKPYGKLSNKDLEQLIAGSRIEVVKEKRSPQDFVLWKKAKAGEPSWPSPWGEGRPGWHIECSAMAMTELGEQFDIHGGGLDLQFPHHENEIAQSEAATDKPFANYWLHVGLLQVQGEKMAKSLGNFFTIRSVLEAHHPETLRYFLLSSHYRSPLNYSAELLEQAGKGLARLYQCLQETPPDLDASLDTVWIERFNQAMNDDFNTPVALSILFELCHLINKTKDAVLAKTLKHLASILGFLQLEPESFLQAGLKHLEVDDIETLIQARNHAREEKNWARADEIRQELLSSGIELEDGIQGTRWRKS